MFKQIILFALITTVVTAVAKAQDLNLNGLTEKHILKTYGKPDNILKEKNNYSKWAYGESMIFFNNGRVSAWSDQGNLLNNQVGFIKFEQYLETWENPWRHKAKESDDKIFLDFLNKNLK